jgi:hypothetical protein
MSIRERPHYVIKPAELAKWLDRHTENWWIVDGDPLLGGVVDFPCPSDELTEVLRRSKRELFLYPVVPIPAGSEPVGQTIKWQSLDSLVDRDNPQKRRILLFSWSDREEEWLLVEYPASKISELHR